MSEALLPCPLCGGEPELSTIDRYSYKYAVRCTKCGVASGGTAFRNDEWNAKKWNSRPSHWQPIDSAPQDGTVVLLGWYEDWPERKWITEVNSAGNIDIARPGTAYLHGRATHWMPLPDGPKE